MKLHQYNEMMAFLTRPKFQDGGPVVPPEKPSSDILFKRKINNLLTGFYGTTGSKGFLVDEIQSVLDEAEKKGVLSKEDGLNFVRERKKYYDNYFADRAQKQRLRGVVEGIGTVDRKDFYEGSLVTEGPNKGKYMVKFPYKQDYGNSKFRGVQYGTKEEIEKLIADRKIAADASYKKGVSKAAQIAKEKAEADIKKTIDSFIKEGDYENFRTKPYESQLKRKLPSGNIRQSVGGRVNPKTFQYISDMLASGDFENLSRITGLSKEKLIEFSNKIPKKGVIDIEQRAKSAKESFPEERKLTEEQKQQAEKKVQTKRKDRLVKTTGDTKFISGSDDFPFHHIKQIGGEVPLKRSDLMVIDKVMNSTLSPYNKKLNDIADSISEKITESFQAMNAKDESKALKILKEVDVLNNQAEEIVKSAQKNLPDKFKPLIGFNKFTARTDEYGFPLDDKVLVEPVGGGRKKGVIEKDLTKYTRKEVQDLQKEINKQVKILELQRDVPSLTTADKIDRPEKAKLGDAFKKFGKYAKQIARPVVRLAAPIIPFAGPAIMMSGAYDAAKAAEQGYTSPDELGAAYYLGPEAAKGLDSLKERVRGQKDETEEFVP